MSDDLILQVIIKAKEQVSPEVAKAASSLDVLKGAGAAVAAGALIAGAAIVGIGVTAVKMAADYQQSMNMVQALTGASNAQMAQYDAGLKNLAMDAGVAPTALSKGLYQIISSGASGARAMQELTLATQDSKIGMTDAGTTADALTHILANFTWQTRDANIVNGEMLETVTLGQSTFQQYASTITKAASTSAQFHISLETMSAAWATMTANGINAGKASTDYVQLVQAMDGKISTITKSLKKNGIAFNETAFNAGSFGTKVQMLNQALQTASQKHVTVTGVTLQAAQALTVISGHMNVYNSDLATLSNHQAMAQKTAQAWAITQSGFNQTMDRLHATLDVVLINIGKQLLPTVTQFAKSIIPVVQQVGQWIIQSGLLQGVANTLIAALQFMVATISTVVSIGADLISFLQNGGIAADAVKVILMALAGAALGFVASAIPELVAGFITWAAAAGAAALATLAAAAPFILIGAIIGAVVAGIILAIKNWGKIVDWLQGVWQGFQQFLVNLWTGIQSFLKVALAVVVGIILGPFTVIGGLFVWLYNHNTYFKKLVDAITGFIKPFLTWFKNTWDNAIGWLVGKWDGLVNSASDLWGKVTGVFKGAWGAISGALGDLWNKIKGWFDNLVSNAFNWGKNLLNGFINGAKSVLGGIGNFFSGVASNIKNFLGFHSPAKEGPGSDADQWSPNLMKMYMQGIKDNIPALKKVVADASKELAALGGGSVTGAGGSPSPASAISAAAVASAISSNGSLNSGVGTNSSGTTVINSITINAPNANAQDVVKLVMKQLTFENKKRGKIVTNTSGGRV